MEPTPFNMIAFVLVAALVLVGLTSILATLIS